MLAKMSEEQNVLLLQREKERERDTRLPTFPGPLHVLLFDVDLNLNAELKSSRKVRAVTPLSPVSADYSDYRS
jgi:hypothetical protein